MREMMRMIALPAQDLMDEYFDSPELKAALSWDANLGSKLAPRSPNNAVLALLLADERRSAAAACLCPGAVPAD